MGVLSNNCRACLKIIEPEDSHISMFRERIGGITINRFIFKALDINLDREIGEKICTGCHKKVTNFFELGETLKLRESNIHSLQKMQKKFPSLVRNKEAFEIDLDEEPRVAAPEFVSVEGVDIKVEETDDMKIDNSIVLEESNDEENIAVRSFKFASEDEDTVMDVEMLEEAYDEDEKTGNIGIEIVECKEIGKEKSSVRFEPPEDKLQKRLLNQGSYYPDRKSMTFVCTICGETRNLGGRAEHYKRHSTERPFKCSFASCEYTSKTLRDLKTHEDRVHKGKVRSKPKPNHSTEPFMCAFCGHTTNDRSFILTHLRNHHFRHLRRMYKCTICNRSMQTSLRAEHIRRHQSERAFECSFCGYKAKTKRDIVLHVDSKHKERDTFTYVVEDGSLVCPFNPKCQKTFTQGSAMKNHIRKVHDRKLNFACNVCNEIFEQFREVFDHKLKEHDIQAPQRPMKPKEPVKRENPDERKQPTFFCEICCEERTLSSKIEHMRRHSEDRPYKCGICSDAKFKTGRDLRHHVDVHHKVRETIKFTAQGTGQQTCPICKHIFANSQTIRIHVRLIHNKNIEFACEKCDESFADFPLLREHKIVSHSSNASLHRCEICGKLFKKLSTMKDHVKAAHLNTYTFYCSICGHGSMTKQEKYLHIYQKHHSHYKQQLKAGQFPSHYDFKKFKVFPERHLVGIKIASKISYG